MFEEEIRRKYGIDKQQSIKKASLHLHPSRQVVVDEECLNVVECGFKYGPQGGSIRQVGLVSERCFS